MPDFNYNVHICKCYLWVQSPAYVVCALCSAHDFEMFSFELLLSLNRHSSCQIDGLKTMEINTERSTSHLSSMLLLTPVTRSIWVMLSPFLRHDFWGTSCHFPKYRFTNLLFVIDAAAIFTRRRHMMPISILFWYIYILYPTHRPWGDHTDQSRFVFAAKRVSKYTRMLTHLTPQNVNFGMWHVDNSRVPWISSINSRSTWHVQRWVFTRHPKYVDFLLHLSSMLANMVSLHFCSIGQLILCVR